jgi:chromosomal replication initiator protein
VDVAPPDFELRCAITQIKAREKGVDLTSEQAQMIAANSESARKIEGVLTRILTEIHIKNVVVTNEMIESMFSKSLETSGKITRSSPDEVIDAVSKYFQIGKRLLLGDSRARPIARPRQVLMYLLRTHLGIPLEEIGRVVGGRDHTTVMHAVEKITGLATNDVQMREDILKIKQVIRGQFSKLPYLSTPRFNLSTNLFTITYGYYQHKYIPKSKFVFEKFSTYQPLLLLELLVNIC